MVSATAPSTVAVWLKWYPATGRGDRLLEQRRAVDRSGVARARSSAAVAMLIPDQRSAPRLRRDRRRGVGDRRTDLRRCGAARTGAEKRAAARPLRRGAGLPDRDQSPPLLPPLVVAGRRHHRVMVATVVRERDRNRRVGRGIARLATQHRPGRDLDHAVLGTHADEHPLVIRELGDDLAAVGLDDVAVAGVAVTAETEPSAATV